MELLSLDFMAPNTAMTMGNYLYNILTATLGNIIGGVFFVAVPYTLMAKK